MNAPASTRLQRAAAIGVTLLATVLTGCSSHPPASPADTPPDASGATPPGGFSPGMRLAPRDPPDVAPPTRPQPALIFDLTTRVEAPMLGEGLHFEIVTTEVVPPGAAGDPWVLRCTVRLRDASGADAGIATTGAKETYRQYPDGWHGPFAIGRPTRIRFFAAGWAWESALTPQVEATGRVRWTVTGEGHCER